MPDTPEPEPTATRVVALPAFTDEAAEWIRLTVLPPMWQHPDGIDELRFCVCQAPPSDWLGGLDEAAARVWDRNGQAIAYSRDLEQGYCAGRVLVWEVGRTCRRRHLPAEPAAASVAGESGSTR